MAEHQDPASRLDGIIDRVEPRLRRRFKEVLTLVSARLDLDALEDLLRLGRIDEALATLDRALASFAADVNAVFLEAGKDTASYLTGLGVTIDFDQVNFRAVGRMQDNRLRLIREFSEQQRAATREALVNGIRRGINPREQARLFRSTLGLTANQERTVERYRALLESGDRDALRRELRDRRFDRPVRRAIRERDPLTSAQVDRMTARYRQRLIAHRARTIARTESLGAVHGGAEEAYEQAFESGALNREDVTNEWITARDGNVRDTHSSMHGQTQPPGVPFVSGNGNALRFPGDPAAPASESIQCRCAVTRRISL